MNGTLGFFDAPRRIAYVCADPGIPVFGCKGASIHVQEVVRSLLSAGHHVTLFANRFGGPAPDDLGRLRVVALPAPKADAAASGTDPAGGRADDARVHAAESRARAALDGNAALHEALASCGPFDLVYERYSLWSHAAMRWAREAGVPGLLEVNAPLIDEQRACRGLVLPERAGLVAQLVFGAASALIAVSAGVADYLAGFDPGRGRIHVVGNGVNPQRFRAVRPAWDVLRDPRPPVVGFLGTLKPWHGVETLIDAFALLRRSAGAAQLSIVGDGPLRADLGARIGRLGLCGHTRFSGALAPERVPLALAEMDIGVAPYPARDDFYFSPLKIVEYMAAGLPVVTTRVGPLADMVRHGVEGLLVAPDDPRALADALAVLLADPLRRRRMGEAGQRRIVRECSWDSIVERLLAIAAAARIDTVHGEHPRRATNPFRVEADAC
ncbi:MAG: glycosyltransferase family 4 protein [Burkholderiaceae bacterium]|jgi:glycosyltransferase involved in cell wall biosynthesis|nr:glycosyltransferase family 4 protein [Burkholderiaceae bacterium]MEB2349842.1 glycosyltransferase family 4 protein [Burkholderiaceae bacterium]